MSQRSGIKSIILVLFVIAVAISGCLNAELNTKINRDFSGTRTIHLEMEPVVYTALESNLSRESLTGTQGAELLSYNKDVKNGKVIMDIVVKYRDLRAIKNIRISENSGILRFEDSSFESLGKLASKSMSGAVSIKYTIEMPYKIESSNADTIEENRATWVIVGLTPKTLYAQSKVPAISGFTVTNLLMAALISMIILKKQKSGRSKERHKGRKV